MNRNSRALDALNFCNAGIQTGLGPFISIYYGSTRHWDPRGSASCWGVSPSPGSSRRYLIALQTFDGVAAAIYGVLLTLVTADLAEGSGRFNFLQGTAQSAMGMGGFLSNLAFGFIAHRFSFDASFWGLSAMADAGGALYLFKMPETKPRYAADPP